MFIFRLIRKNMSKRTQKSSEKAQKVTNWSEEQGLMYLDMGSEPSNLVLAMDLDSTLICTKSGKTFAQSQEDWKLLYENIPKVLKEYPDHRKVIISNQAGIEKGKQDKKAWQNKVQKVVEALDEPVLVMASIASNHFRKPCTGMWDYFTSNLNGDQEVDLSNSFYIGDAAGRPAKGTRKKDFNDTDLKFALNVGLKFQTPEQFFLGQKETVPKPQFDPKQINKSGSALKNGVTLRDIQECIIFVGSPASGKSTFWKTHLSDYVRVNNDTLKTKARCLKEMEKALQAGKSCVIDNTNPTEAVRSDYIRMAQNYNVPVRCFTFKVTKDVAFHLNALRGVNKHRQQLSGKIPAMPIHKFFKDYESPSLEEGFEEIQEVDLVAGPFENEQDEKLFFSFVHS